METSPAPTVALPAAVEGMSYTNIRSRSQPLSIHLVRVDLGRADLEVRSVHAGGGATGLASLTAQVRTGAAASGSGVPLAGVNGDFYQRDRSFAGDPRGLQVVDGEVLSAPNGGAVFWMDASGRPGAGRVASGFEVTWPDGQRSPIGLNAERIWDGLQLYTAAVGSRTRTFKGREWVLEPADGSRGPLTLRLGAGYTMRVRSVSETGESELEPGTWVLSAGPGAVKRLPRVDVGATLKLSTATTPDLSGARQAIGGGPMLVQGGRRTRLGDDSEESYETSSMHERHPRSAVGWNREHVFLVTVDGRQPGLSMGMTLDELAGWLTKLGCEEAMNLDGGGSATLWYGGAVRNRPCEYRERPIANALVVVRKPGVAALSPGEAGSGAEGMGKERRGN